ncbi:glycosyltransferase [Candidatus Omnitrophota bacterium]
MINKTRINSIYLLNEFTDLCNLKCIMCDHGRGLKIHGEYPLGLMPADLFENIVNRLKNSKVHLSCFHAGWLGEPLCHPEFSKLTRRLFAENNKDDFFDSFTMNTNGLSLNKEIADVFLDYAAFLEKRGKGFFRIHLSLHAATEKMYQKITAKPGENLKTVLSNLDYLMRERKRRTLRFPNLTFLFVVTQANKNEAEQFLKFWSRRLKQYDRKYEVVYDWPENYPTKDTDAIYFRREDAYEQYKAEQLHKQVACRLGLISKHQTNQRIIRTNAILRKNSQEQHDLYRRPCPALWRTLVVHNSGLVVPCCSDLHLELKVGDLNTQSLEQIWNGREITEMRLAHIRGDFKKFKRCFYCNNIDSFVISDQEIVQYLEDLRQHQEIESFLARMRNIQSGTCLTKSKALNVCLVSREYPEETGWGGIGRYTHQLAHSLAKKGCQVHVISLSLNGDREYMDEDIHVHRIAHRELFPQKLIFQEFAVRVEYSYKLYQKLKQLIKKFNIDIIEAPNFFAEAVFSALCLKTPLVVRLHSSFSEIIKAYQWSQTLDRRLSCALEDASISHCNLITSSTKSGAQALADQLGIDAKRISIIPLGIETPQPITQQPAADSAFRDRLNVLFVGRLERRKGVHILMRAIPHVLKELPQTSFTLIGRDTFLNRKRSSFQGPQRESFRETVLRSFPAQYKDNVHFLGYVAENKLSEYYSNCDLFVAPSLYESFGFIYVEAMAHGKAVVGSKVGGVAEVVIDQGTGILVPPKDVVSLAEAIISLLKDRPRREKMGQAARRHVELNFTRELMAERTLKMYRKVLDDQAKK